MPGWFIGRDTVTLVFRDPVLDDGAPVFDVDGRPTFADREVVKSGSKFTIDSVAEDDQAATYSARCALPVDADTTVLAAKDAIRFDGKLYEMAADARVKYTLIDAIPHHVRAFCTRAERVRSVAELVTITARGGQDDDGARLPDGTPTEWEAVAVDAGNTAERYGGQGTTIEADFTVVLPLGTGIRDGDWILVRGRQCVARIQREFSEHADRNQDVVLARFRGGG